MGSFAVHHMTQLEQQVARLTHELAEARAALVSMTKHRDGLLVIEARKDAEIERLRAALKKIADDGKNCMDHCRRQAQRALEQ